MEQYAYRVQPGFGTHRFRNYPGLKLYDTRTLAKYSEDGPRGTYAMGKRVKVDIQKILNPGPIIRQNAYPTRAYKTPAPSTLDMEDVQRLQRGGMVLRIVGSSGVEGQPLDNPHPDQDMDVEMAQAERLLDDQTRFYGGFAFRGFRGPQSTDPSTSAFSQVESNDFNDAATMKQAMSTDSKTRVRDEFEHALNLMGTRPMDVQSTAAPSSIGSGAPSVQSDRAKRMRAVLDTDMSELPPAKSSRSSSEASSTKLKPAKLKVKEYVPPKSKKAEVVVMKTSPVQAAGPPLVKRKRDSVSAYAGTKRAAITSGDTMDY